MQKNWPVSFIAVILVALSLACLPSSHATTPGTHSVKYVVYSDVPASVDIYYRDTDPPDFADFSHNPYQYSPKVEANLAPGTPWQREASLANPDLWAMVAVSRVHSSVKPEFHCELLVDGVIAASNRGPMGALCSLRQW
jgi:hypothetical protein